MAVFSHRSMRCLSTCHKDLQIIAAESIKVYDFAVTCGFRGYADQEAAFRQGKSNLHWPNSKHNKTPAMAFDAAPWPIDWKNIVRFEDMGVAIMEVADRLYEQGTIKHKLEWGGDWVKKDYPHFELKEGGKDDT